MMNGRTPEWSKWYEEERDKKKAEKKKGTPEEQAERGVYKNINGDPIVPAGNIRRMLRDAFAALTNSAPGYRKLFDSSVTIFPSEILLKFKPGDKILDERSVNISRTIPDFRYRYKFRNWSIEFEVWLRCSLGFDGKQFMKILCFAGQFVGLMDARTIGSGRFEVVKK